MIERSGLCVWRLSLLRWRMESPLVIQGNWAEPCYTFWKKNPPIWIGLLIFVQFSQLAYCFLCWPASWLITFLGNLRPCSWLFNFTNEWISTWKMKAFCEILLCFFKEMMGNHLLKNLGSKHKTCFLENRFTVNF